MLQDQSQQPTRRKFYAVLVNLLGAAAAAVIAVPAAAYLLFRPKSPGSGTMVEVASLADLETGVPERDCLPPHARGRMEGNQGKNHDLGREKRS